ncbi:4919_t:CDS:2, partial [Dentiscutata heterogama]
QSTLQFLLVVWTPISEINISGVTLNSDLDVRGSLIGVRDAATKVSITTRDAGRDKRNLVMIN